MVTKAMKQRTGTYSPDESVIITRELMDQFLNSVRASGRQQQTVRIYKRNIEELFAFLPEEKKITRETLEDWRESLKKEGYTDSTINTKLVAVNGLLRYCSAEGLLASHERLAGNEAMPELTREEYLQFLSKVRETGSEKYYFLIKVFASVDVSIGELDSLTVEACREGMIHMADERIVEIPCCLRKELLQYADRHGILKGPVFLTRDGKLMNRSNITNAIHKLAVQAGMDPEACCPSALHRLFLTTQRELRAQLHPLFVQSYESLLNTEQTMVAWK